MPSVNEIEITPQMIEAGMAVLISSGIRDAYLKADRYTVAEIFRAMHLAREKGENHLAQ